MTTTALYTLRQLAAKDSLYLFDKIQSFDKKVPSASPASEAFMCKEHAILLTDFDLAMQVAP